MLSALWSILNTFVALNFPFDFFSSFSSSLWSAEEEPQENTGGVRGTGKKLET